MRKFSKLFGAVALLAMAAPALALTVAKASITDPVITVVDLNLADGVDAGFTAGGTRLPDFHYYLRPAPVGPIETVGNATVDIQTLSVMGQAHEPNASFVGVADRWAPSFTFTATPNTQVKLSVDYELSGSIEGEAFDGTVPPSAMASLELMLVAFNNLEFNGASGELSNYDLLSHSYDVRSVDWSPATRAAAVPDVGTMTLTFDNLSNTSAVFAFRAEMVVAGHSADRLMRPVPEPESVALMLAGLGALAWRVRRRSSSGSRLSSRS